MGGDFLKELPTRKKMRLKGYDYSSESHYFITICTKEGYKILAAPTKSVLAKVVNAFKALTSKQFGEPMWQRSYHDHIIRDEAEYHAYGSI